MVAAFIKSNYLDSLVGIDDTHFSLDLYWTWVGTLRSAAIQTDGDALIGVVFPYTELISPAAFAAHLKQLLTDRAAVLGYSGLASIEIMAPTRIAVP